LPAFHYISDALLMYWVARVFKKSLQFTMGGLQQEK
jgi:hypothetical protein